jgi:hypothetical protein
VKRGARSGRASPLATVLACAIACVALLADTAAAADVQTFGFSGQSATALFLHYDGSCTQRIASVLPVNQRPRYDRSGVSAFSVVDVTLTRFDYCHSTWSARSALVRIAPRDFRVRGDLRYATLRTSVVLRDWVTDEPFRADLDLTWRAAGDSWRDGYSMHTRLPDGSMQIYRQTGRLAMETVSGSISDGQYEYTAGKTAIQASLATSRIGQVQIIR